MLLSSPLSFSYTCLLRDYVKWNFMKKWISILFIFAFFSCGNVDNALVFNKESQAHVELLEDSLFIGYPLTLQAIGKYLFITDYNSPMMIQYDLEAKKELRRFITEGRGPNETQPPLFVYKDVQDVQKLYYYSGNESKMNSLKFGESVEYQHVFTLPFAPYIYQKVIALSSTHFLATGEFFTGERYQILGQSGEILSRFGDFPAFLTREEDIPYDARSMFHEVDFETTYGTNRVASLSEYVLDIIEISPSYTGSLVKRISLAPYDYTYTSGNFLTAKAKEGYMNGAYSLACDHKYIYVLFSPNIKGQPRKPLEIWVFDWDGRPVKKVFLAPNVRPMALTSANKEDLLYGVIQVKEDYHIITIAL